MNRSIVIHEGKGPHRRVEGGGGEHRAPQGDPDPGGMGAREKGRAPTGDLIRNPIGTLHPTNHHNV